MSHDARARSGTEPVEPVGMVSIALLVLSALILVGGIVVYLLL